MFGRVTIRLGIGPHSSCIYKDATNTSSLDNFLFQPAFCTHFHLLVVPTRSDVQTEYTVLASHLRLRETSMKFTDADSKKSEDNVHPMRLLLGLDENDRLLAECPLYQC